MAILYKIPLIVSFRGNDASAHNTSFEKNQIKYQELIEHGSLFLPVCEFFKGELMKLGFQKEKLKVLYCGIDIDKFTFRSWKPNKNHTFRILTVGRLVEKKGFPILIQAFRKVHKKFPKAKLVIIGKGRPTRKEKLSRQIKKYNLDTSIELITEIKNGDIVKELHHADLFCLPSYTTSKGAVEGIPNVLKEAMSCGVPVVSTYHAGIPELIEHNRSGILVKEEDDKALAEAIITLLKNPKQGKKYAKQARQKVKKDFNLNKQIHVQEQYYDHLFKDKLLGGAIYHKNRPFSHQYDLSAHKIEMQLKGGCPKSGKLF
ncbi:glycosyltransferase [Paenibacillus sp. GP183]|uniref:glycosyltransferase n=1 Tax=Paenibacillus sp. GP183 TaxID=1882751 RepID=UPI00209B74CD|nr:glycosyltransferase [Paenibacillus sp. GP183]